MISTTKTNCSSKLTLQKKIVVVDSPPQKIN